MQGGGEWKEGALEGHRGAGSRPKNPFPLIQSLGEAFSIPLPPLPAFRSLKLYSSHRPPQDVIRIPQISPSSLSLDPLQSSILT